MERKGYDFLRDAVYPMFYDYFREYPRNRYDWNISIYGHREKYYTEYESDIPNKAKYLCDFGNPSDWESVDMNTNISDTLKEAFGNDIWEEWEKYQWENRDKNPTFLHFLKERYPEKVEEFENEAQSWASDLSELFEEENDEIEDD